MNKVIDHQFMNGDPVHVVTREKFGAVWKVSKDVFQIAGEIATFGIIGDLLAVDDGKSGLHSRYFVPRGNLFLSRQEAQNECNRRNRPG